ncbi:zinc-finger homeodomain protein 2-like [Herrania umbratica]|uniref:Zinc-finger homeodomain protein 2-like n=1 Tax=Herrania umbratica TaxID=108875 RepID=A0A6J1AGY2_9ROSI|nr:zinc-finger homeodomain protein 2-like [Herrania umbratica]
MDDNNGAGHEQGQAQANAVRRRINRQAVGEQGVTYMECRRNVSLPAGHYSVDGCSEFLKREAGRENAMLCDACGCHRSFHRKVLPTLYSEATHYLVFNDIPSVRPMPQPQQPPIPLVPQPELPHEQVAESESEGEEEEEERSGTDEESEDRSELDSESEVDEVEMINGGEKDSKED